jgi:hypothetical protein
MPVQRQQQRVACRPGGRPLQLDFIEGASPQIEGELLAGRCEAAILYDLDIRADDRDGPLYATKPYALVGQNHPLSDLSVVTLQGWRRTP